jgi:hypothetical protein
VITRTASSRVKTTWISRPTIDGVTAQLDVPKLDVPKTPTGFGWRDMRAIGGDGPASGEHGHDLEPHGTRTTSSRSPAMTAAEGAGRGALAVVLSMTLSA